MNNNPDMPNRKRTRLKNYNYSQNNDYFITICTQNRKCILSCVKLGNIIHPAFIKLTGIGEIVEKYILSSERIDWVRVLNYVIMPNHIHILVRYLRNPGSSRAPTPTTAFIPRYVSTLKRFINREIGYNIWQRGYHDHIIRDENDYKTIRQYIDGNPTRWIEDKYYIEA